MLGLIIAIIIVIIAMYALFTYFTPRYRQIQRVLGSEDMWLVSSPANTPFYMRFGQFKDSGANLLPSGMVLVTRYNGDKMFESESDLKWSRTGDMLTVGGYRFSIKNVYSLKPEITLVGNVDTVDQWMAVLA